MDFCVQKTSLRASETCIMAFAVSLSVKNAIYFRLFCSIIVASRADLFVNKDAIAAIESQATPGKWSSRLNNGGNVFVSSISI